jgi:membrane-associated phospholipid phosphatase
MNYWIDLPVTGALFASYYLGYKALDRKTAPTSDQIINLNKTDVWKFDRVALYQDVSYMDKARDISDWGLRISQFLPVLLFIDGKIRKDWYDIALLYFETQAVALNSYLLGGPFFIDRYRPHAYYSELSVESNTNSGTLNSWFSGHTSTTATASFFMAKVIIDYHPELGGKKWLVYAAALIPPAFVGYYRIKALKHFPTDVLMGTAVGASIGILVPHFHKLVMKKNNNLSFVPFAGSHTGVLVSLKF